MIECFNVTETGYLHTKFEKRCQDFSSSYSDGERTIVTACDGHGGEVYIRSHKGSRFASHAALHALLDVEERSFRKYDEEEIEHKLKLNVLCEWNRLVKEDLEKYPIRKSEMEHLNESQIEVIKQNPIKAYGTTLTAAMIYGTRLICIGLGDGGCFVFKNGEIASAFCEDDEPVANITYSLCGEDAFEHIKAKIIDARHFDGVLICTDGVLGPYQTMENFKRSFVCPVISRVIEGKARDVKNFICELGSRNGIGDDVSLAMIIKGKTKLKRYSQ